MSALSELLKAHQGDRSVREIGRACHAFNGVGATSILPYFSGKHGASPREDILVALAHVMPLPLTKLREAAGVPPGEADPYAAPAEASRLNFRQRNALDELIKAFTGSHDAQIPTSLGGLLGSTRRKGSRVDRTQDGKKRKNL
mgnify:CR=1 FL=1